MGAKDGEKASPAALQASGGVPSRSVVGGKVAITVVRSSMDMLGIMFWVSYIMLWLVVIGLTATIVQLTRMSDWRPSEQGARDSDIGPNVGEEAPSLSGRFLESGEEFAWSRVSGATILVFVGMNCRPCWHSRETIGAMAVRHARSVNVILSCKGTRLEVEEYATGFGDGSGNRFIVDVAGENPEAWDVDLTPFAFGIDKNGVIVAKARVAPRRLEDVAQRVV